MPTTLSSGITYVSSGTSESITVGSGATLLVYNSGAVINTLVSSGGAVSAVFGGAAISTTVLRDGLLNVFLSGTASDTLVSSGGTAYVDSGGAAISTTVLDSGLLNVYSNGTASNTLVSSGGAAYANDGGTAISTTVLSGGLLSVFFSGTASDTLVSSGGTAYVDSGGAAISTTVLDSGLLNVYSNGTASNTLVSSGGAAYANDGGTAISTTVLSGGLLSVFFSGTASDTLVSSGGTAYVDSGGTAISTSVLDSGLLNVFSNGTASNTLVSSGGTAYAINGGTAISATVLDSGLLYALASSTVSNTLVNSGGVAVAETGGIASGTMVLDGGQLDVLSSGTAINTLVSSGGYEYLGSGGIASGTTLLSGGMIDVTYLSFVSRGTVTIGPSNTLNISEGSVGYSQVLSGSYTGEYFHLTMDSSGSDGTLITLNNVPCFCRGTRIATPSGDAAVEDLRIGDLITLYSGSSRTIRWIGRRSYSGQFASENQAVIPVLIRAGALGDGVPRRDLMISPQHAMYLDDMLVPAICLVNGASIIQLNKVESVEYFHIELDLHEIILADGAPTESFVDDDSRMIFHNALEYGNIYPNAVRVPVMYCAPRVTDGFALAGIRERLAVRAGIRPPAESVPLRGCIDQVSQFRIEGWAQNPDQPEVPVCLDALIDGKVVAQTLANLYRVDLERAGLGSGRHAFRITLPIPPTGSQQIVVLRSSDNRRLPFPNVRIVDAA